MLRYFFSLLSLFFLLESALYAQGCSDGGFCTMGAMRPDQGYKRERNVKLRTLEVSSYQGFTKFEDVIHSIVIDAGFSLGKKSSLQFKLPYTFVYGPLANTHGLGDLHLSYTRKVIHDERFQVQFTVGTKVPLNTTNQQSGDGRPLPMYYQTSLGTFDFITGASLITRKWLFAMGYQQALNPEIDNNFFWGAWADSPLKHISDEYPVARALTRGKDIMMRVERNFRFSKFNFALGVLNVQRISQDEITSPATGERVRNEDTTGAAITGLLSGGYHLTAHSQLRLLVGQRLKVRGAHSDGLSRERVVTFSYQLTF